MRGVLYVQEWEGCIQLCDGAKEMESSDFAHTASEVNALAATCLKKHAYHLLPQLHTAADEEAVGALRVIIHRQFLSSLRVLFLRGLCAESHRDMQACLEAAGSMREEYDRRVE